jgi:cyanophycinase
MKYLICLIFISTFSLAGTNLILIGGGKRPAEAMKEFIQIAGGTKAKVIIFPWASASIESAEIIKSEFSQHAKANISIVPHELTSNDVKNLIIQIKESSGIFFTGGDQNVLMNFIKKYDLKALLQNRFQEGVVFGGTSAGTAIMSDPMLSGTGDLSVIDGSQIGLTEGLGLLPTNVIVDQHFIIRQRFNRLAGVILQKDDVTGIGVDENTAFLIQNNSGRVIGPSQVLIFEKRSSDKLMLTILAARQTFSFSN